MPKLSREQMAAVTKQQNVCISNSSEQARVGRVAPDFYSSIDVVEEEQHRCAVHTCPVPMADVIQRSIRNTLKYDIIW